MIDKLDAFTRSDMWPPPPFVSSTVGKRLSRLTCPWGYAETNADLGRRACLTLRC